MKIKGRVLIFKQRFYDSLDEILDYYEQNNSTTFIQKFLKELDETIIDKIAPRPESHPEYKWKRTPDKVFRRAIFRKNFFIIYKMLPNEIQFLLIIYSGKDLESLPLG